MILLVHKTNQDKKLNEKFILNLNNGLNNDLMYINKKTITEILDKIN